MVMKDLEQTNLTIFSNPPSLSVRYVDDVFAIMETEHNESFHLYLNTINSSIQFTKEIEASGSLAFLGFFFVVRRMALFLLMFTGNARIPVDIYLIHLTILLLKSSALPETSTQEPIISSTNQNINWPSSITSTKHYKTMDFLCVCALAINFLLSRLNLILDLILLINTPRSSQFHMCREFLRLLREFWPKSALEWL